MTSASDMAAFPNAAASGAGAEKAAWYREVLDLEPGSKVFLPFARLLMELGRADEAVSVLRDGLDRHPEFMEARLFLIDVLHKRGDATLCGAEVARLAGLFRSHPGFWEAWGDVSAAAGERPDLAVSLGFLGALFRDEGLTLADVLAAGLKSLRSSSPAREGETAPAASRTSPPPHFDDIPFIPSNVDSALSESTPENAPRFVFGDEALNDAPVDKREDAPADDAWRVDVARDIPSREGAPFGAAVSAPRTSPFIPAAGGDRREKCSLRTRSMAEVLAEQGDVHGAVDIYEELLASCRPEDRAALLSRLEDLRAHIGAEGGTSSVSRASASAPARSVTPARNGVLDLLEKLAVRLENKARQ